MRIMLRRWISLTTALITAAIPAIAWADTTLPNPLGESNLQVILGTVLQGLFGVLGSVALLMFIYGGFLWLTSGGNADMITKGKNTIIWAILGIAVIFTAYTIVDVVVKTITGTR